jgi:hypothetical protein
MTGEAIAIVAVIISAFNLMITLVGGIVFIIRLEGKLNVVTALHGEKISNNRDDIVYMQNAHSALRTTVEQLRRGAGWINDADARTVSREY